MANKTRKLKTPNYKSFKLQKKIKPVTKEPLPSTWQLLFNTVKHLWANKKLFGGILLIYALLSFIFVWAGGNLINTSELKTTLSESLGTSGNNLVANITLFSLLLGSSAGGSGELGSTYQTIIIIVTSLALIWAFRSTSDSDKIVRIRDAFYRGVSPVIPFVVVLFIIGLQLLPLVVASFVFGIINEGGLAITALEQAVWILLFVVSALLSLYMVSSSLFGLFVVTLPNMTPLRALKNARQLVLYRRLGVMRRLFLAMLFVFAVFATIVLLAIYFATFITEWVFLAGMLVILPVAVGFVYKLYKALI